MNKAAPWLVDVPTSSQDDDDWGIPSETGGSSDPLLAERIQYVDACTQRETERRRRCEEERKLVLAKIELKKLEAEKARLKLAVLKATETAEAAKDERDAARLETDRITRMFKDLFRSVIDQASTAVSEREMRAAIDKLGADEKLVCQACRQGWAIRLNGRPYCPHCCEEGNAVTSEPPF